MAKASLRLFSLLLTALLLAACTTISPFSQTAYEQAVSLKVEAMALMDRATQPYAKSAADVAAMRRQLDVAYEYAKGRPKNDESTAQWALLKDPNGHLLGGFLKRWEAQGQLSGAFVGEAKRSVGTAFDSIIQLESGKRKKGSSTAGQGG